MIEDSEKEEKKEGSRQKCRKQEIEWGKEEEKYRIGKVNEKEGKRRRRVNDKKERRTEKRMRSKPKEIKEIVSAQKEQDRKEKRLWK